MLFIIVLFFGQYLFIIDQKPIYIQIIMGWSWQNLGWSCFKIIVKTSAKMVIKCYSLPLVVVVEVTDAAYCAYQGDYVGAGICLACGVVDLATCGAASAIKQTVQETSKKAAVEATRSMVKQTTEMVGKYAGKQFSHTVGKQLSKSISSGTITSIGQQAFKEASANTVKRGIVVTAASIITAPLQQGAKTVVKVVSQFTTKEVTEKVTGKVLGLIFVQQTKETGKAFVREAVKNAVQTAGKQIGVKEATKSLYQTVGVEGLKATRSLWNWITKKNGIKKIDQQKFQKQFNFYKQIIDIFILHIYLYARILSYLDDQRYLKILITKREIL